MLQTTARHKIRFAGIALCLKAQWLCMDTGNANAPIIIAQIATVDTEFQPGRQSLRLSVTAPTVEPRWTEVLKIKIPDGSDNWYNTPVEMADEDAAVVDTEQNWTGYELTEKEMPDCIRCPSCKKFPFESTEIQVYNIVRLVMFRRANNGKD